MLALPLIVIGNAFEETVKEEERYNRERQKRMEIKMLQRFGEGSEENEQAMAQLEAIQKASDEKKAKQKYSNEVVGCANMRPLLMRPDCRLENSLVRILQLCPDSCRAMIIMTTISPT